MKVTFERTPGRLKITADPQMSLDQLLAIVPLAAIVVPKPDERCETEKVATEN